MPYFKSGYEDDDHFTSPRVVEFRNQFKRAASHHTALTQEQFQGSWNRLKGEIKQQWGRLTDDDLLQIEGDRDKFHSTVQTRYGEMQEEVTTWLDRWHAGHVESVKISSP